MKKLSFCLTALLVMAGLSVFGQGVKLTPFGGYTVQDKVYGYYGDVIIEGGGHYGATLTYERSSNMAIDLMYSYQSTTFNVKDAYTIGPGNVSGKYTGSVSYILLGSRHSPDFNAKVAPYGGLLVGAAIFNSNVTSETWRFAVGGKVGAVYHVNDKFGIMIQAQLLVPVQGVGVYFGTGGAGASTTSTATQLGFNGGVEIKLR